MGHLLDGSSDQRYTLGCPDVHYANEYFEDTDML